MMWVLQDSWQLLTLAPCNTKQARTGPVCMRMLVWDPSFQQPQGRQQQQQAAALLVASTAGRPAAGVHAPLTPSPAHAAQLLRHYCAALNHPTPIAASAAAFAAMCCTVCVLSDCVEACSLARHASKLQVPDRCCCCCCICRRQARQAWLPACCRTLTCSSLL
jgi:hypothetical protein